MTVSHISPPDPNYLKFLFHLIESVGLPNALVKPQARYHLCGEGASEKFLSAATLARWRVTVCYQRSDTPICDAFAGPENGAMNGVTAGERATCRAFARSAARGASRALEIHSQIPIPTVAMPSTW